MEELIEDLEETIDEALEQPTLASAVREGILGAFDGLVSVAGLTAGLLTATDGKHIFRVAVAAALAATLSMAGAEFLADNSEGTHLRVVTMALSVAAASIIPVLPWLFLTGTAAILIAMTLGAGFATCVAEMRHQVTDDSRLKAYSQTFGLLIGAIAVAALVGAS